MPEPDLAPPRPAPRAPDHDDSAGLDLGSERGRVNVTAAIWARVVGEVLEPLGDRHVRLPLTDADGGGFEELRFKLSAEPGTPVGEVAEVAVRQLAAKVEKLRSAAGGDVMSATAGGLRVQSGAKKMEGRILFRCPAGE